MIIPKPLLEDIVNKKCLPFIGAGLSLNAELPSGKHMVDWDGIITDLRNELRTETSCPLEVAQEYEDTFGRPKLIETLEKILHIYIVKPGDVHKELVRLGLFDVIYTTNFDKLLEDACKQENIQFRAISAPKQISLLGGSSIVNIIKMHGELPDLEYLVFTKKDYSDYESKYDVIVAHLKGLLTAKTVLFLGYSLQDPNFQQIKQMVEKMMGPSMRKSYIVLLNADQTKVSEYEKMNLYVINLQSSTKSKSELLLEFIKEISNYKTPKLLPTDIQVSAHKSVVIYGETLEIRTRVSKIPDKAIALTIMNAQNEIIYKGNMDEEINEEISSKKIVVRGSKWHVGEDCTIVAEYDGKTAWDKIHISEKLPIVLQTDKSVYIYGSDMIVTIVNPNHIVGIPINLEIIGLDNKLVYKNSIPVQQFGNGIYQEIILVGGKDWSRVPGSQFRAVAEFDGKTAEVVIYTSNFGATIQLDQKVYTWTDRVYITVVAPDFNRDPNMPDVIGDDEIGKITVSTKGNVLSSYKLVETGPDTGIFTGYVVLTGNPALKGSNGVDGQGNVPSGQIGGEGPIDGMLSAQDSDKISVSFKITEDRIVTASAIIRWNIGQISWLQSSYPANGQGVLQIVDPDMNLNPKAVDKFDTRVWSDSDSNGIKVTMIETGPDTGIFQSTVNFVNDEKSPINYLKVAEGDCITAEYVDRTLPLPYTANDQLRLTATAFIGTIVPPLERIKILNSRLLDSAGNTLTSAKTNQEIHMASDLVNDQNKDQPFAYLVQVQDDKGITVSLTHISGTVSSKQSSPVTQRWIPTLPGNYTIQIFVWRSIENPNALCPPTQIRIRVV
ncbi:MAG: SIR2 family protein [Thaumarchaeota archaeon]|nr:SIR2 family protein [Nitrososphaerota archaeon]